jgi:hypothetical protein
LKSHQETAAALDLAAAGKEVIGPVGTVAAVTGLCLIAVEKIAIIRV